MSKLIKKEVNPNHELPWTAELFHNELDYNRNYSLTMVAMINEETKTIRPTHGYYTPNKTGVRVKRYAEKNGYMFAQ